MVAFNEYQSEVRPANFAFTGSKSVTNRWYNLALDLDQEESELIPELQLVCDFTFDTIGDGRMNRNMPYADPVFGWCYASAIPNMTPRGEGTQELAVDTLEISPVPTYLSYSSYDCQVEFTSRGYPIMPDHSINLYAGTWYPDSNTDSTGNQQTFTYADESQRYCEWVFPPDFDFLSVSHQSGVLTFQTSGTTYNGVKINGSPIAAKAKMLLPNMKFKLTCYGMPLRYWTSTRSYLTGGSTRAPWIGRVNQNSMYLAGCFFPKGSLLYLGANPAPYTPPIPQLKMFAPGIFSSVKLVNIEFNFAYTTRTSTDLGTAPTNQNYIQAGHNLLPSGVSRKFHYAATAAGMPYWSSAPLELLFTDPDVVQTVG